jgi:hypothetical protein
VESDLAFLDAAVDLYEDVERERQRALADMARLETLLAGGLLQRTAQALNRPEPEIASPEHVRALAVAYLADYRQVRRHVSAVEILDEVCRAAAEPVRPGKLWPRVRLSRRFGRYWQQHGHAGDTERRAAWRAVLHNVGGARDALVCWDTLGAPAREHGERLLGEILLHPGRITEQLISLRTIQTLAILDVLNYRRHVYELGGYADMGDQPGELLEWRTTEGQRRAAADWC